MAVTLQDIATRSGVTKSTVSFTLRNHPKAQRFSLATRQRIMRVAEEVGYRPNFFAVQLSARRPRLLLACRNAVHDEWASHVIEGLETYAAEQGYRILTVTLQDVDNPLALHRDLLGRHGVSAAVILGGNRRKLTDEVLTELLDDGVSVALVNRAMADPRAGQVLVDNYLGGRLAAQHLYQDLGLNEVWVLGTRLGAFQQRMDGFRDMARELGRPAPYEVSLGDLSPAVAEHGHQVMTAALEERRPPQGLFAIGDLLAVGACHALAEHGRVTGRDVAVVGFDGGIYSTCHYPPLTTVVQPMLEMGAAAAKLLINMLEGPDQPTEKLLLPPTLRVQGSTRHLMRTTDRQSDPQSVMKLNPLCRNLE